MYNVFTITQMWWCKSVSRYGICDINTLVNMKLSFTVAEMSHITIFINMIINIHCKSNFSSGVDKLISFECMDYRWYRIMQKKYCFDAAALQRCEALTLSFQLSQPFYMNDCISCFDAQACRDSQSFHKHIQYQGHYSEV